MMAAAIADQQKAQYAASTKKDFLNINNDGEEINSRSDTSEHEYFDAQSHVSTQSPSEDNYLLDPDKDEEISGSMVPKIIETVAKKHFEDDDAEVETKPESEKESVYAGIVKPLNRSITESVIEREIRYQREREEALIREREEALKKAAASSNIANTSTQQSPKPIPLPTVYSAQNCYVQTVPQEISANSSIIISPFNPAETRIALELREMREREEELRKLRNKTLHGPEVFEVHVTTAFDDGFSSIPNTDESNFSENGSEGKEITEADNTRQAISPEVPVQSDFQHHRTQSVDSTSSGHSSGSGGLSEGIVVRRRIVVKPFEEPQDEEVPTYMRKLTETPIEREIRLSREREEELRREKGLSFVNGPTVLPSLPKQEVTRVKSSNKLINDPRSVQHRLATSRIQHEIDEAAEREGELRKAGTIQMTSEDTVDSKVTRFTDLIEYQIEEQERKMKNMLLNSDAGESPAVSDVSVNLALSSSTPEKVVSPATSVQISTKLSVTPQVTPKRLYVPLTPKGQRGLMERFLASRGKLGMNSSSRVALSNSFGLTSNGTYHKTISLSPDDFQISEENDSYDSNRSETSRLAIRPKYTPAEDKIQNELRDMQRREEELRLQRARMFASSQPNLLSIIDDKEEETHLNSLDDTHILRTSQSNPNLLDATDFKTVEEGEISGEEKNFPLGSRKRNSLIAEWESRIQQATDH
ncbi:uncharacterized protein LOC134529878 [Bacillus rossius redtenbacheri]|uniref:uncharacterized protein LOC134529878 n=1 Tax=Bacillus rossius redtenbacheri TaxID=93214 RepID=UPI002FDDF8A4